MRSPKLIVLLVVLISIITNAYICANEIRSEEIKYFKRALKLHQNQRFNEANTVYNQGLKKYPSSLVLRQNRGKLKQGRLKDYIGAIKDYTKVIKINPKYEPKAFWRRGDCFYELKLYKYAIKDYSSFIKISPKSSKGYFKRAKLYKFLGMRNKAIKDLEVLIKMKSVYSEKAKIMYKDILYGC